MYKSNVYSRTPEFQFDITTVTVAKSIRFPVNHPHRRNEYILKERLG